MSETPSKDSVVDALKEASRELRSIGYLQIYERCINILGDAKIEIEKLKNDLDVHADKLEETLKGQEIPDLKLQEQFDRAKENIFDLESAIDDISEALSIMEDAQGCFKSIEALVERIGEIPLEEKEDTI